MEERMIEWGIIIHNMQKQPFNKTLEPYGFDEEWIREIENRFS
jgi:hypothetical protein